MFDRVIGPSFALKDGSCKEVEDVMAAAVLAVCPNDRDVSEANQSMGQAIPAKLAAALGDRVTELQWEPGTSETGDSRLLVAQPGRVIAMEGPTGLGLTRLGLTMLASASEKAPVVAVDVRGWLCPVAAWEVGVVVDKLTILHCDDPLMWPKVMAALIEGVRTIYAEIPNGIHDQVIRRLAALARARDSALILRPLEGTLPAGISYLDVKAVGVEWEGPDAGHGRLEARKVRIELTGKGVSGMRRRIEVEDDGTHAVRVVSRLAAQTARRAVG
ncbi:MAG TPA: hypothetical protein ENH15_02815 [Actinobacteria bacterium]|nr:hypothetical protein [Actinomycetota bacterium]